MTQGAKIGLVTTIGTGVVGGGVGTAYALKKPNSPTPISIQQQIKNSGRTILDVGKSDHWNIKVAAYKTDIQSITSLTKKNEEGLKNWCSTILRSNYEDEKNNDYSNAKKLCTVPTNKEKLLSLQKELAGKGDWGGRAEAYNSGVSSENLISTINKGSANETNIKAWCEEIFRQEISKENNPYAAAEKWCTKG